MASGHDGFLAATSRDREDAWSMGPSGLMRRNRQREVWANLGRDDADWGVLTTPSRRHGGWHEDLDAFYASGREAVEECLRLAAPQGFSKALDFGAGTGRLSFALASRFEVVTSLDVSQGMLDTLTERATASGICNVTPMLLGEFRPAGDHDFALSLLVLQHLASRDEIAAAIRIIAESLRPGGVAVVEIPQRPLLLRARLQPRMRLYSVLRSLGVSPARLHRLGLSGISMTAVNAISARGMFNDCGLSVIKHVDRGDSDYLYVRWVVRNGA